METSTLRWILIIIGVIIVGSIFLFGNPEKKRKPKASRKKDKPDRHEPTLDYASPDTQGAEDDEFDHATGDEDAAGQGELDIGDVREEMKSADTALRKSPPDRPPTRS